MAPSIPDISPASRTTTTSPISSPPSSPSSADKLCMVCNDRSLGYNFNAITCESCKAFFRRNALTQKTFLCPFNDNCEITVVTRRFCQKCRLDKCFAVGMRKEYIMSEEDKRLKKAKIEQNRTKRKPLFGKESVEDFEADEGCPKKIKRKAESVCESSDDKNVEANRKKADSQTMFTAISSTTGSPDRKTYDMPTLDSTSTEIVDRLVNFPEEASKLINQLMHTPNDAVTVMTKIIHSQKDAMRLIGHLIASPGDALKIISKIMNSPFDALTVFTKFMSSPTDALEIIAKIASSPEEVLQFIQQLMNSPEDALQIMNKFMNSPAEALKLLNQMVNNSNSAAEAATTTTNVKCEIDDGDAHTETVASHSMIKSMLSDNNKTQCKNNPAFVSAQNNNNNAASPSSSIVVVGNHKDTIRDVLNDVTTDDHRPISDNTLESVICEAISLEYDLVIGRQQPLNRDLNEAERAKLNELIVANKALNAPLDEDLTTGLDSCSEDVSINNFVVFYFNLVIFMPANNVSFFSAFNMLNESRIMNITRTYNFLENN